MGSEMCIRDRNSSIVTSIDGRRADDDRQRRHGLGIRAGAQSRRRSERSAEGTTSLSLSGVLATPARTQNQNLRGHGHHSAVDWFSDERLIVKLWNARVRAPRGHGYPSMQSCKHRLPQNSQTRYRNTNMRFANRSLSLLCLCFVLCFPFLMIRFKKNSGSGAAVCRPQTVCGASAQNDSAREAARTTDDLLARSNRHTNR